ISYDIKPIPGDRRAVPAAGKPAGIGLESPYSVPSGTPAPGGNPAGPAATGDGKETTFDAKRMKMKLGNGDKFKVRGLHFKEFENPDGSKTISVDARKVRYKKDGQRFKARNLHDTFTVTPDGQVQPGNVTAGRIKGKLGIAEFEKDLSGLIQTAIGKIRGAA
ncbi:MAG: hypothetical protein FJZ00_10785, partial [Candidatus Sericytochromatia bacterium]|nr:hypothetical protein [Candidatus Tanganyikabacteria bacterium]